MKELAKLLFSTFSIQRWNDLPRPVEFVEMDKQAHKMIIAFVLAHYEKDVDFEKLIHLGIASLFYRAVLTDLKSPVLKFLRKSKSEELDEFVLSKLENVLDKELKYYVKILNSKNSKESRILKAASYIASKWEFEIIYNFAPFIYTVEDIKKSLENEIEDYYDLEGVKILSLKRKTYDFISLCGNLRFQKRWSNTPRMPQSSVLGHMLFVAVMSYFFTKNYNPKNLYYNFFTALFHDLPEALTRDIIAPIKYSVSGLDELLKDYENSLIDNEILPLLRSDIAKELEIMIKDEFSDKIITEKGIKKVETSENLFNFEGINGKLIKIADNFAAFIEAKMSINYGIKSPELISAVESLQNKYKNKKAYNLDLGELFL